MNRSVDAPFRYLLALFGIAATLPLVGPAYGQVFAPGPSIPALFDDVISLPSGPPIGASISGGVGGDGLLTQLNVNPAGSITSSFMSPFIAGDGAEINIDGGAVGGSFEAIDGSEVNLLSGSIGVNASVSSNRVDISGGTVGGSFTAADGAEVNLSAGSIGDNFTAETGAEINLIGGEVGNFFRFDSGASVNFSGGLLGVGGSVEGGSHLNITGGLVATSLNAGTDGVINVSGGTVGAFFGVGSGGEVNISGGEVGLGFIASDGGVVNISGGVIGEEFRAPAGGTVNLIGTEFVLNGLVQTALPVGVPIDVANRGGDLLSGTLADGSFFSFDLIDTGVAGVDFFAADATLTITLISDLAGDYNNDGAVDALDYLTLRDNFGAPAGTLPNDTDGGPIGADQFATFVDNFDATPRAFSNSVATPEPAGLLIALLGGCFLNRSRRPCRGLQSA